MAIILGSRAFAGHRPTGPFTVNRESPQAQGLAGWWPITPGRQVRNMVTGRLGAYVNMTPSYVGHPQMGGGLKFDGSNDLVRLPYEPAVNQTGVFYIALWTRTAVMSGGQFYVPIGRWEFTTGNNRRWLLERADTNKWRFRLSTDGGDGGTVSASDPTATADNTLYHVSAGFVNGSQIGMYVNGVLVDGPTSSGFVPSDAVTSLALGIMQPDTGSSNPYNGTIFDARVVSGVPLSPALAWHLYDPATRLDLYGVPSTRVFFDVGAAAAAKPDYYYRQMRSA